jgi:hypothetical protein
MIRPALYLLLETPTMRASKQFILSGIIKMNRINLLLSSWSLLKALGEGPDPHKFDLNFRSLALNPNLANLIPTLL